MRLALLALVAFIAFSVRRSALSEHALVGYCVCVTFALRAILFMPFTSLTVFGPNHLITVNNDFHVSHDSHGFHVICPLRDRRGSVLNNLESLFYIEGGTPSCQYSDMSKAGTLFFQYFGIPFSVLELVLMQVTNGKQRTSKANFLCVSAPLCSKSLFYDRISHWRTKSGPLVRWYQRLYPRFPPS
jgi:hypothetical protein